MEINEILKVLRTKNKFTQKEVAEKLLLSRPTYNAYEQKISEPNIDTLIKLAEFYNTTIDYLVGRDTDLINLNAMDSKTKKMIENILQMNDSQKARCESYIDGIMGK